MELGPASASATARIRLVLRNAATDSASEDLRKSNCLHSAVHVDFNDLNRPAAVKSIHDPVLIVVPGMRRALQLRPKKVAIDIENHRFGPTMNAPDPSLEIGGLTRKKGEEDLRESSLLSHERLPGRR
jgi:hypothetical protein